MTVANAVRTSSSQQTLLQAAYDQLMWKLNANEHKLAYAGFALDPRGAHVMAHQLMHTLKNYFPLQSVHVQNAFVAQQSWAEAVDHGVHELAKPRAVKRAIRAKNKTLDVVVIVAMMCGGAGILGGGCFKRQIQLAIEIESAQVEHFR